MSYYAVIDAKTGEAVSFGSVTADDLDERGLEAVEVSEADVTAVDRRWSPRARAFEDNPDFAAPGDAADAPLDVDAMLADDPDYQAMDEAGQRQMRVLARLQLRADGRAVQ